MVLPDELERRLRSLGDEERASDRARVCYFHGPQGVGKESAAAVLSRALGLAMLAVDVEGLLGVGDEAFAQKLELAVREASLQGAALFWRGFDRLLEDDARSRRMLILERLEAHGGWSFLAGEELWEPADALHSSGFLRFEFPLPDVRGRRELWTRALNGQQLDPSELASAFRLSGGQIRDAAATARSLARRRSAHNGHLTMDDLQAACRLQSNRKLTLLARHIIPRYGWGDIVLPTDRLEQLREIVMSVRYRAQVFEEWGFERKLSLGKGLAVLFAGPSGTGKTMAAEILAGELGLDLYKIDLSTVVSKFIGETEKNLSRIFAEAETSNAILFFDEADALFGKRTQVRDAHDRYANLEISYLLQRMEEYEGVVILATNLRKNMDDAFVRRVRFTVDFPFPGERDRRRIWEGIWADEVPRAPELDFELLARQFELTGGNIRNVALGAAFRAAEDGGVVGMEQLLHGVRREFQKMGKVMGNELLEVQKLAEAG